MPIMQISSSHCCVQFNAIITVSCKKYVTYVTIEMAHTGTLCVHSEKNKQKNPKTHKLMVVCACDLLGIALVFYIGSANIESGGSSVLALAPFV